MPNINSSIFKLTPKVIFTPKNIQGIQEAVRLATKEGRVISVQAGATCMAGGSLNNDIMLDLKPYVNAIKVFPYSKSAIVEMGAYYRDLESAVLPHNLMFAPYTSSKQTCGVGGMIGNNASGEKSIRYGATIDNVQAVSVVLHDGEVYEFEEISEEACLELSKQTTTLGYIYKTIRYLYETYGAEYLAQVGDVKKSSSGYRLERVYNTATKTWNLSKLFVGSQGTLGIITSARLKLVPTPLYTRTIIVPIDDLATLPVILRTIMKYNPEGVETFDVNTWFYGKQFLPEDTLRVSDYFAHGEKLVVFVEFSESTQEATDTMAQDCVQDLAHISPRITYTVDPALIQSMWAIRRSSFSILRDATYDDPHKKAVPCMEDVIVPVSRFDVFIPKLIDILTKNNVEFGFHGHIGDGALRIIPIIDFTDPVVAIVKIEKICKETFALIKELRGNMSADHGDGIIRTPFLRDFYGGDLFEHVILAIKKLFDPNEIFNSGKKDTIRVEDWVNVLRW